MCMSQQPKAPTRSPSYALEDTHLYMTAKMEDEDGNSTLLSERNEEQNKRHTLKEN